MNIKQLQSNKTEALEEFKKAKETYLKNPHYGNWIAFCDAKSKCKRLGIII